MTMKKLAVTAATLMMVSSVAFAGGHGGNGNGSHNSHSGGSYRHSYSHNHHGGHGHSYNNDWVAPFVFGGILGAAIIEANRPAVVYTQPAPQVVYTQPAPMVIYEEQAAVTVIPSAPYIDPQREVYEYRLVYDEKVHAYRRVKVRIQ